MRAKLKDIVNGQEAIERITKIQLPIKASYGISRIKAKVDSEVSLFKEKNFELIRQYGELVDEKTQKYQVTTENMEKYQDDINKMAELEIDIEVNKIDVADLGDIKIEPELLLPWIFMDFSTTKTAPESEIKKLVNKKK